MSSAKHLVFSFILCLLAGSSQAAQVYRCTQADGHVSFQQQACAGEGTRIETGEAQAVWASLRSTEKSLYEQYRKRDQERRHRKQRLAKNRTHTKSADPRTCWKKRKQLESVSAKLRQGYKPSKGDELRRRRDYYEDYLRLFCP